MTRMETKGKDRHPQPCFSRSSRSSCPSWWTSLIQSPRSLRLCERMLFLTRRCRDRQGANSGNHEEQEGHEGRTQRRSPAEARSSQRTSTIEGMNLKSMKLMKGRTSTLRTSPWSSSCASCPSWSELLTWRFPLVSLTSLQMEPKGGLSQRRRERRETQRADKDGDQREGSTPPTVFQPFLTLFMSFMVDQSDPFSAIFAPLREDALSHAET